MSTKFAFPRTSSGLAGDLHRLVVHLEHIAEAASLLRSGGIVRERMALVAADHLAEVLLQDHMERTFVLSEEMGALTPRRWDRKQRRQLINDFNARIELARTQPTAWPAPERLLDARDESVFRVAHAYRNALYHGDRHNAGLGRSLAVEYLQAVGRTLVRSWSAGGTIGGIPASDARLRAFRRLGSASARSSFQPRTVADECVRHLVGRFRVQRKTLCQQLERDLEERARRVDAILDELGRRGIARPLQSHFLRAALLWAAYRADPELVRLEDEHAAIVHNASGRTDFPNDDDAKAYAPPIRLRRSSAGRRWAPGFDHP